LLRQKRRGQRLMTPNTGCRHSLGLVLKVDTFLGYKKGGRARGTNIQKPRKARREKETCETSPRPESMPGKQGLTFTCEKKKMEGVNGGLFPKNDGENRKETFTKEKPSLGVMGVTEGEAWDVLHRRMRGLGGGV